MTAQLTNAPRSLKLPALCLTRTSTLVPIATAAPRVRTNRGHDRRPRTGPRRARPRRRLCSPAGHPTPEGPDSPRTSAPRARRPRKVLVPCVQRACACARGWRALGEHAAAPLAVSRCPLRRPARARARAPHPIPPRRARRPSAPGPCWPGRPARSHLVPVRLRSSKSPSGLQRSSAQARRAAGATVVLEGGTRRPGDTTRYAPCASYAPAARAALRAPNLAFAGV